MREYLLEKRRKQSKAIAKVTSTMIFSLNILTKIPKKKKIQQIGMFYVKWNPKFRYVFRGKNEEGFILREFRGIVELPKIEIC